MSPLYFQFELFIAHAKQMMGQINHRDVTQL